jgi:glycosyltransferase involved in cell wall biosynthesis
MKTVLFKPLWKLRPDYEDLIANPPQGYRFIHPISRLETAGIILNKTKWAFPTLEATNRVIPVHLLRSYVDRFTRSDGVDLIYAVMRLCWGQEPWVVDFLGEQPHVIVGGERVFAMCRSVVRKALGSPACRRIIYDVKAGKQALLSVMRMPELERKVIVVYPATSAKSFVKRETTCPVRLLFVGSANIDNANQFETKGGRILLEAFLSLRQRYKDLELVVRSRVPRDVKDRFRSVQGLTIMEETLPPGQLEQLFLDADILVAPVHTVPSKTIVQAMSYELPIVMTDVWSASELIDNGRTGILIHHPTVHTFTDGFIVHFDSPNYRQVLSTVNPELVRGVVESVTRLIEDPELRRRMGREARREVEGGRFSTKQRNNALKRVLDEATAAE